MSTQKSPTSFQDILKKILQISGILLGGFLLILGILWGLIQIPSIQQKIVQSLTKYVSGKTNSRVEIGRVDIDFFHAIRLERLYLEDQRSDTLAYIENLEVNLSILDVFQKTVFLDEINLEEARIHLEEESGTYNFQFLIDAFSSTDSSSKDTTSQAAWDFGLRAIGLEKVYFTLETPGFAEDIRLGKTTLIMEELDLANQKIRLENLTIHNSTISHSILSKGPPSPSTEPMTFPQLGWNIETEEIELENIGIRYDDQTAPAISEGFDYNHLHLSNLNLSIHQLEVADSIIQAKINKVAFEEKDGFSLTNFATHLIWSPEELKWEGLVVETPNSQIFNDTKLGYASLNDLITFNDQLKIQSRFSNSVIDLQEIEKFVPEIANFLQTSRIDGLRFSGGLEGSPIFLKGKDWFFESGELLSLAADFEVRQLTQPDSMQLNLQVNQLTTQVDQLDEALKISLPVGIYSLGNIQYVVDYQGGIYGGKINGKLISSIGKLNHDGHIQFNSDYSNATYALDIVLDKFNLGTIAKNDSLGEFSLQAAVSGSGLTLDNLSTRLDATVSEMNLLGYAYKDLEIHGQIAKQAFSGELDIRDKHLALNFNGEANFNDSIPQLSFLAKLDTIDFDALHLSEKPIGLRADLAVNLRGNQVDNLEGTAHISNFKIKGSGKIYTEDTVLLSVENLPNTGQKLSLTSDIVDVLITGNYSVSTLPGLIIDFINPYFPLDNFMPSPDQPDSIAIKSYDPSPDQDVHLSINLTKPHQLTRLFIPQLTQLDSLSIDVGFDSKKELLEGYVRIPQLVYNDIQTDSLVFDMRKKDSSFHADFSIANFQTPSSPEPRDIFTEVRMRDQSMRVGLRLASDSIQRIFQTDALIKPDNDTYLLNLDTDLYLNDYKWSVDPDNGIQLGTNDVEIKELSIQRGKQQLNITGNTQDSLSIGFKHFALAEISNFLAFDDYHLEGQINGFGHLMKLSQVQPFYVADMSISNITLNDDPIGDLDISAKTNKAGNQVEISTYLKGKSELEISGIYDITEEALNGKIDINRFELGLVQPFTSGYLNELSGILTGNLKVSGKPLAPEIRGDIGFENTIAHIDYLNTSYTFPKETISIQPNKIRFNKFTFVDAGGNQASLTGELTHQKFENIRFDFDVNSRKFLFLNKKPKNSDLFYGSMLLDLSTQIRGTPNNIYLTGNAKTLPGTNLTVFMPTESDVVIQEDYVLFVSPENFDGVSTQDSTKADKAYQVEIDGVTINMNLEITPETQFTYVLDSSTGEKVQVNGSADLSVGMNTRGDISIRGIYEVKKGNYRFSYESLITKDFDIQPGSKIIFSGDPLDAQLDITAAYTTRTTTYELIGNELADPNSQLAKDAKKRSDVRVLLRLNGEMMKPDLNFDIEIPDDKSGPASTITDAVGRKLVQIRQDESELNQQVMGLLLFGSFFQKSSSLSGTVNLGTLAVSSISGFLTNQLNQLADKYIQGVEININLESYQSNYASENTVSQLDIGLSRRLLNDRLTVSLDTGIGLETQSGTQAGTSLTQITGSFILSYNLTEDGRYTLQVFRKSDTSDPLNGSDPTSIKTGVGAKFRKNFD